MLLASPAAATGGANGADAAGTGGGGGKGGGVGNCVDGVTGPPPVSYPMLPVTSPPAAVIRYKESPVGMAGGGGAGGKAGMGDGFFPGGDQGRWDAAEWARTLQRLGLDAHRLSQFVDNLRGALYAEIVGLLDRLGEAVDGLEARYGVPRELMLDLRWVCRGGGLGRCPFLVGAPDRCGPTILYTTPPQSPTQRGLPHGPHAGGAPGPGAAARPGARPGVFGAQARLPGGVQLVRVGCLFLWGDGLVWVGVAHTRRRRCDPPHPSSYFFLKGNDTIMRLHIGGTSSTT